MFYSPKFSTEILKSNTDFVDSNGDLLREQIKDKAWQFDRALVNLLLSNETIAEPFFDEVSDGRFIFNNTHRCQFSDFW